jgi:hypothetical protein
MKFIVGFVLFGLAISGKLDFSLIVKDLKETFFFLYDENGNLYIFNIERIFTKVLKSL